MFALDADNKEQYDKIVSKPRVQEAINAIHEAGHAVSSILLKRKFSNVTLKPKEKDISGKVASDGNFSAFQYSLCKGSAHYKNRKKLGEREIKMLHSGDVAEYLYFLFYHEINVLQGSGKEVLGCQSGEGDFEKIEALENFLELTEKEKSKLRDESWNLIMNNWGIVVEVANSLIESKKLKYFQVREILKVAQEKYKGIHFFEKIHDDGAG